MLQNVRITNRLGYWATASATAHSLTKWFNCCASYQNPTLVKGNHEAAALGEIPIADFNHAAANAASWTAAALQDPTRDFLRSIPNLAVRDSVTLCHGSPRDPIWEYLLSPSIAEANLRYLTTSGCVHGHTHVPNVFGHHAPGDWEVIRGEDKQTIELGSDRWFVNPGSVGQPRDYDPRASYALLHIPDCDEQLPRVQFHRVEYDISRAQNLILAANLPPNLAFRLSAGR